MLWFNRIEKAEYEFKDFWQRLSIEEMEKLVKRNTDDWKSFIHLQKAEDFPKKYSYVNSKGKEYSNTLMQIITHVINHSTYHRAQIASLLKSENINPPYTDYIGFFR